ncbi:MAG: hypothetical protein HKM04_10070 [Legionellales bacterium]|nr:hypothetical protein [Legionellales bacterium]
MRTLNTLPYAKLKLKIDYPELSETWLDGYESASKNFAEEDNPFSLDSLEYQHWRAGWWAGFFDEPALFNFSDTPVISRCDELLSRIEEAGKVAPLSSEKSFYEHLSIQTKAIFTYIVQCIATIMTFTICYQFADFFA